MEKIINIVNETIETCKKKELDTSRLAQLMDVAAKNYLKQFTGETRGANALGIGAFLCGDMDLERFVTLTVEMVRVAERNGIESRNYFEFLFEEVNSIE